MALRRTTASLSQIIRAPLAGSARGAVCLTCHKLVDEESIVDGEPGKTTWCKVLVRHHGQDELRTFDMASVTWDFSDVRPFMDRTSWFDPTTEGVCFGVQAADAGDHDGGDA